MIGSYVLDDVRNMIVGMREAGLTLSKIRDIVGRSKSTISKVLKRYNECGFVKPTNKLGRPHKLSDQGRRRLMRDLSSNYCAPLAELCENIIPHVGMGTLHKEIHELGVNGYIAVKKPFLNDINRVKRLAFAKQHVLWMVYDWNDVIWTNESSFEVGKQSCQIQV
jgi:transposase